MRRQVVAEEGMGLSAGFRTSVVPGVRLPDSGVGLISVPGAGDVVGRWNGAALPVTQDEECAVERCRYV